MTLRRGCKNGFTYGFVAGDRSISDTAGILYLCKETMDKTFTHLHRRRNGIPVCMCLFCGKSVTNGRFPKFPGVYIWLCGLLLGACSCIGLGNLRHRETCTKTKKIICNVKKKNLTSDEGYAIMPKVKGNALTQGGFHGRIAYGAAVRYLRRHAHR